jgi:hypothetical protein
MAVEGHKIFVIILGASMEYGKTTMQHLRTSMEHVKVCLEHLRALA